MLFGLVKLGIALCAIKLSPEAINLSKLGVKFALDASSNYSF